MNNLHTLLIIFISGGITLLLRFLPFIAFGKHQPKFIIYLGKVLPPATMAMLVIYCLRNTDINNFYALPEIIACLAVIILHVWKHNTLLSIITGTAIYMYLIQNAGGIF